jgi:hypothetical protein
MIFIHLDSIETATKLVKVCEQYNECDIDVVYGRHTVDGRSLLGVMSFSGKIVNIVPVTDNSLFITYLTRDLKEIGAWVAETN